MQRPQYLSFEVNLAEESKISPSLQRHLKKCVEAQMQQRDEGFEVKVKVRLGRREIESKVQNYVFNSSLTACY